ncbi:hypothetical protein EJ04DRAFT_508222 [Polyplosphaeria fusca]|uniref:Synaptobrevin n=1 Tax=Polyplosphaeria fusca TaxID=682080 RepID=A0A9P4RB41_9PLEO|nr:hypothetical protein EJ04DRAFT_508222 [Polyplosphaeria fusca]
MAARPRSPPSQFSDPNAINLSRLLSRLEHTILSPEPTLRTNKFERARVGANLEHARTLLLNLEHSASSLPSKSKKSALQTDLQQKRELIKQLNQRLYELEQLDDTASEGSADSDDEDEDLFPSYAPAVKEQGGMEVRGREGNEALQAAASNLTAEVRSRRGGGGREEHPTSTGSSLFPQKPTVTTGDASLAKTEALLSHNRAEQDTLTNSLLEMAKQLKLQSKQFGSTLEADKGVLDRAVEGLDRNTQGMEAAGQRMGTLRRMTEGRGWWDRMKLYALIFGLWVVAFLIVFVGPKIRF